MQDKKAILHLKQNDSKLGEIIPKIELEALNIHNDLYYSLSRSIVAQQLSVKAAATIHARFIALFADAYPEPTSILDMDLETLRSVGLSKQKASYIKNVAQYTLDQDIQNRDWTHLSDEAIIKELTAIKGVGKWTVQMLLMFTLARPDVFPIDDLGIQQGMARLYDLDTSDKKILKKEMEEIAEKWQPYRSLASRYIWKWKDS